MTMTSNEVREGRMINFNTPLWVVRKWNDGLDMNKEIVNIQNP